MTPKEEKMLTITQLWYIIIYIFIYVFINKFNLERGIFDVN